MIFFFREIAKHVHTCKFFRDIIESGNIFVLTSISNDIYFRHNLHKKPQKVIIKHGTEKCSVRISIILCFGKNSVKLT